MCWTCSNVNQWSHNECNGLSPHLYVGISTLLFVFSLVHLTVLCRSNSICNEQWGQDGRYRDQLCWKHILWITWCPPGRGFHRIGTKGSGHDIASEKAPGLRHSTKQAGIYEAVNFFNQHDQYFNLLNSEHVILIPKKANAKSLNDFRPISLLDSVAKLVSKMMAVRLRGDLNQIVSRAQSAFMKKRIIQDNFLHRQNIFRELHRMGKPTLFFKLDIVKAFDTVRWDYLLGSHRERGLQD